MASLMKKTEQYQALPAKVSQQVLRGLDRNWQSFFAASSEFKTHPDKFLGKPKIPGYKEPKKGRNLLVYTIQAISKGEQHLTFVTPKSGFYVKLF
jgi:putative transposase